MSERKMWLQKLLAPAALVILYALFAFIGKNFTSWYTTKTILESAYFIGFMAFGVTFVIITGGIDLSIGTSMMCSAIVGCVAYSMWGWPLWLALFLVPLTGLFFGVCNGLMVAKLKLPPFIATLGTMLITQGFSAIISKVQTQRYPTIGGKDAWFKDTFFQLNLSKWHPEGDFLNFLKDKLNKFPLGSLYLIAFFFLALYLLNKTRFGRYTYAIGSNEEAARLSGVKTDNWKILVYSVCGLFAGIAAIFYAAVYTTAIPATGNGRELDAIAGVVIGGTSMAGGSGTMLGTLIGVFIMAVLKSGLSSVGLQAHWQTFITGFVVIGAVLLDIMRNRAAIRIRVASRMAGKAAPRENLKL